MSESMRIHLLASGLLPWVLLFGMLLLGEIGWRTGRYLIVSHKVSRADASETFVAAIFGFLALLIAFTFSGASDRYDQRRALIVKELLTMGTAYMSVDRLNQEDQPRIRELFRSYLDHRITLYQHVGDTAALETKIQAQSALANQLWQAAVKSVNETGDLQKLVAAQILPEISTMFDAFDDQRLAMKFHPPPIIWQALMVLALIGALLSGYNMGIEQKRDWLLTLVFVVLMAGAIYVILNLEFPRLGSINLDEFEQELIALRKSM